LAGQKYDFDIEASSTVYDLKLKIEEKLAITVAQQRLLFNGRPLLDEKTFADQSIAAGSVLSMVMVMRGGF
jgi:ubiquitin-like protein Nedd8